MDAMSTSDRISNNSREEQPERRIYSAPGAMRNPKGRLIRRSRNLWML